MASTTFVDGETLIEATWLNDVNAAVYTPGTQTAADIANVPAGSITATDVQAALNELDTEKVAVASIGTTVQAWDAQLDALALLSTGTASGNIPLVGTESATEAIAGLLEIATDAEAQAFAASKAIDGAKLNTALKGANQSITGSGYQRFPGGLIIQWGSVSFVDFTGTTTVPVTFPLTFPNAILNIVDAISLTAGFNTAAAVDESTITTSGFTAIVAEWNTVAQTGGKYRWIAIGY